MSDLIKEGFEEINTESTPEYKELFNQHLFAELTVNTRDALSALKEDANDVPSATIEEEMDEEDGLFVEKVDKKSNLLGVRLLDPSNKSKLVIEVSANDDELFAQPISTEVWNRLSALAVDPDIAVANVKSKLSHAI